MPAAPRRLEYDGQIASPGARDRILLAGGACNDGPLVAYGYLGSDGQFGVHAHRYPPRITGPNVTLVCSLRAYREALERIDASPVTLVSTSAATVKFLRRLQSGDLRLPSGYSCSKRSPHKVPALFWLARKVRDHPDLRIERVADASNNPLNQAVDAFTRLAYLAAFLGQHPEAEVVALATTWASQALKKLPD